MFWNDVAELRFGEFAWAMDLIPLSHLGREAEPRRKYRLMEQVRFALRARRLSVRTEKTYCGWIRRYILFHGRRHPRDLDESDAARFLTDLAVVQRVSASTQNQAMAALVFLYSGVLRRPLNRTLEIMPARRPQRLPVVLSQGEVRLILTTLQGRERLVVSLLYGSGLRIRECVSMRVKDIDIDRCEITVRGGKGDKDRRVPLAASSIDDVRRMLRRSYKLWKDDTRRRIRVTGIDGALSRKLPRADAEWSWYYVFPATRTFVDSSGVRRRHHLHESQVQRAVGAAVRKAGLGKRVTCHSFRHSFATHLLEAGSDIRTIQQLMGHADVRTTMVYTHVLNRGGLGVQSPADRL